jgi:hypothetical protein
VGVDWVGELVGLGLVALLLILIEYGNRDS